MVNAPDTIERYRLDLARALKEIDKREPGYRKGREFYDGTRAEVSASAAVQNLLQRSATATPISLAHIPVDVIADKVELHSLTVEDKSADKVLAEVVEANDLEDEGDDWIRKACYLGDYYAVIDPTLEDGAGRVVIDGLNVLGVSPFTSIVIYSRNNDRLAEYGVRRWEAAGGAWRARLYYDDCTVRLLTGPGFSSTSPTAEDYQLDLGDEGEDGSERLEHEGGRMLLRHLAVGGKPYGVPIHVKAYGPQDAITKISATNLSNVDGQGFASRWALADPLAEIDDDLDDDFGTDGPTTQADNPTKADGMTHATAGSRVRTVPGAIAILRGVKSVGQFNATETDNFLKNLDWYVRVMAVACGIPLFEFDLTGEQPSGESRRRAEGRSNKKARKVQREAASFFEGIGDTVLGLLGIEAEVVANFAPLETSTDKDGLELIALKVENGIPLRQALLEAGYTDEQVDEWWPEKAPSVTMGMLKILASALAQLGTAKTLGVITDEELRDMLPTVLTAARGEGVTRELGPGIVQPFRQAPADRLAIEA